MGLDDEGGAERTMGSLEKQGLFRRTLNSLSLFGLSNQTLEDLFQQHFENATKVHVRAVVEYDSTSIENVRKVLNFED